MTTPNKTALKAVIQDCLDNADFTPITPIRTTLEAIFRTSSHMVPNLLTMWRRYASDHDQDLSHIEVEITTAITNGGVVTLADHAFAHFILGGLETSTLATFDMERELANSVLLTSQIQFAYGQLVGKKAATPTPPTKRQRIDGREYEWNPAINGYTPVKPDPVVAPPVAPVPPPPVVNPAPPAPVPVPQGAREPTTEEKKRDLLDVKVAQYMPRHNHYFESAKAAHPHRDPTDPVVVKKTIMDTMLYVNQYARVIFKGDEDFTSKFKWHFLHHLFIYHKTEREMEQTIIASLKKLKKGGLPPNPSDPSA